MSEKRVIVAGMEFPCQGCQGWFYRVTDRFSATPPMRGNYVELLPKYGVDGYNWYDFPHDEWTVGDNVACVQCGEPIRIDHVIKTAVNRTAENEEATEGTQCVCGDQNSAHEGCGVEVLQHNGDDSDSCIGADVISGGSDTSGVGRAPQDSDNVGIYDDVTLEDQLLNTVLRMTTDGRTQPEIAEACGISVYRVRKLQNGEIK